MFSSDGKYDRNMQLVKVGTQPQIYSAVALRKLIPIIFCVLDSHPEAQAAGLPPSLARSCPLASDLWRVRAGYQVHVVTCGGWGQVTKAVSWPMDGESRLPGRIVTCGG